MASQIYTNEIPLGHITYAEFIELVVWSDVRPERPDNSHDIGLSDDIWKVAEHCWAMSSQRRPNSGSLYDQILHLVETHAVAAAAQPAPQLTSAPPIICSSNRHTIITRAETCEGDTPICTPIASTVRHCAANRYSRDQY